MVIGNLLEKDFRTTLRSQTSVVSVWNKHFPVFCKFLSNEVETIFWESEAKHSRLFKSKFCRRNLLEKGFGVTLSSKAIVLSVWKERFSVFCKLLSDEVKINCWKSYTKRSKLFKSKFGTRKLLRKWFWSYFELKSECSERLERAFFRFLQIFEWGSWNHFLGKWGKTFNTI